MGYIMVIKLVTHWDAPLSRCRPKLGLKPYTFADWLLKVTYVFFWDHDKPSKGYVLNRKMRWDRVHMFNAPGM